MNTLHKFSYNFLHFDACVKTPDRIALILTFAAFFASLFISLEVFEGLPHIEDEITYVWQARLAAAGKLVMPSPVCPGCFLEPFVIDKDGIRFGKYPPGWPAALSLGIQLGIRPLVNPFISALFVWFNYLLVRKLLDPVTAVIASFLTLLSPFFLINSGTLLSHPWSLLLAVWFSLAWLDTLSPSTNLPKWLTGSTAALCMGLLILTRPLTAVGICIPFFIHGLYILAAGTPSQRWAVLAMGAASALVGSLYLLWQYRVTGDPFLNPYVLYWPYDRIGFGPDVGLHPDGHQLKYAYVNTRFSLQVGVSDLFGWPYLSWLFLPFGCIAIRKNPKVWPVAAVFFSLVLVYGLYWIGAWLFGPRYYYEGFFSLSLLSAAGIRWLAGKAWHGRATHPIHSIRFVLTWSVIILLTAGNLLFFLPQRLQLMRGLYGITASQLEPFKSKTALDMTPALVIVNPQDYWLEYGALLELSSPLLDSPFIFTYDRGPDLNQTVINAFPQRKVIYYNPADPYVFAVPPSR
jgi:hypothetical protein